MKDISFSTAAVGAKQKLDSWRNILSQAFGPIEVTRNSDEEVTGSVRTYRRAQLQFNEISYRGQSLERTSRNVAEFDKEYFTLSRPISGPLFFEQHDRAFTVEPGCMVLLNQTSPYKASTTACYHAYSISIPRAMLEQRDAHIGSFYKLDLSNGSPRGQLLSNFARHMTDGMETWSETETISLREQLLDLIVLLMVNEKNGYSPAYETSVRSAHRERAITYIKHNHCSPLLNPKTIAAACGISVNYLHKIFQAANLQVEQYIYSLRLETCRKLLQDPAHKDETAQQIAYKTGFSHPSHFSRLFKEKFGMSPKEFRYTPGKSPEPLLSSRFDLDA
ncbi:helix-turn-helix domain-containing protein [soil metagenome]